MCLLALFLHNNSNNEANAKIVAEVLVEADLRGISSHGVNRLYLYCNELSAGRVNGYGIPKTVLRKDYFSTALVDGDNAQGAVGGFYCMKLAIQKAR